MSGTDIPLTPKRLYGNWKLPATSRQFMVRQLADQIDEVHGAMAEEFSDNPGRNIYRDERYPDKPGTSKALLVISEDQPGHQIGTTILLQRRGKDLFFELSAAARTRLRWLHKVVRLALVASIFFLAYGAYFRATGQGDSVVMEYARKYFPMDPKRAFDALKNGQRINSAGSWEKMAEPIDIWEILKVDPKLFLTNTAGPPALILLIVAVLIGLMPPSAFDGIARFIGWPTTAEFGALATAEVGSIDADACLVLGEQFGVRDGDIREVKS